MEMNEGYQDREDPGPDRPLPARRAGPRGRVAAWSGRRRPGRWRRTSRRRSGRGPAVRPGPPGRRLVLARRGHASRRRSAGRSRSGGAARARSSSAGATRGPFDDFEAVRTAFAEGGTAGPGYEHRVVAVDRGRRGRGHGHRPHRARRRRRGLPAGHGARACRSSGRSTRTGIYYPGFGWLSGREAPAVTQAIVDDLERRGLFYHLEPYTHRYPHCWRCGTPLLFRLVDEWFITMGPVYDKPRDQLTKDGGRRQPPLPDHGGRRPDQVVPVVRVRAGAGLAPEHARLDDLQEALLRARAAHLRLRGVRQLRRHRRARGAPGAGRSRAGTRSRAHTPHRPVRGRGADRVLVVRRAGVADRRTSATRGWTPGSCRSPRSTSASGPTTGRSGIRPTSSPRASRASSATGSTRCSRWAPCSAASRRSASLFGYALVFGEDGRPMHKSWGNAIEFDEAADRMGVDVMRWLFASARPEDNIRFGWHAADEARRELLVLWNVYAFFVAYARLAGWTPAAGAPPVAGAPRARSLDPVAGRRHGGRGRRHGSATTTPRRRRGGSAGSSTTCRRGTCACRASGCRAAAAPTATRRSRRSTRRSWRSPGSIAPILPFLSEAMYGNLVVAVDPEAPDSVHLDPRARRRAGAAAATRAWRRRCGTRAPRGRPRPDAPRPGRAQGAPAAGQAVARDPAG